PPPFSAVRSAWQLSSLTERLGIDRRWAGGIAIVLVDPKHTSQRCNACGHTERRNRKSQAEFCCVVCGHTAHADCNAAANISWAAVIRPSVSEADSSVAPGCPPGHKPPPLGVRSMTSSSWMGETIAAKGRVVKADSTSPRPPLPVDLVQQDRGRA